MKKLVAIFLLLLCSGCVTIGKERKSAAQSHDSGHSQAVGWTHQNKGADAFTARSPTLTAFFDKNDTVAHYNLSDDKSL